MICSLLLASSYVLPPTPRAAPAGLVSRRASGLQMAELRITGNIQIGEAPEAHARAKLGVPLEKFAGVLNDAQDVELHLKVEKRGVHDEEHSGQQTHRAEVTAPLKGKHKTINVGFESEDMYASIDELEAKLQRALRKAKEKQTDTKKSRKAKSKSEMEGEVMGDDEEAMMEALEEEQLLRDAAAKVVKPPAAAAPSASDSAEVANAKANAAPAVQIGAPAGFEWGETF